MNDSACTNAMKWFREYVYFSNDYSDIPTQLLEYSEERKGKNYGQWAADRNKAQDWYQYPTNTEVY